MKTILIGSAMAAALVGAAAAQTAIVNPNVYRNLDPAKIQVAPPVDPQIAALKAQVVQLQQSVAQRKANQEKTDLAFGFRITELETKMNTHTHNFTAFTTAWVNKKIDGEWASLVTGSKQFPGVTSPPN